MRDGFVKVAVATPEVRVADCVFNREKTQELILQAAEQGVKLLVLPELGMTGYTCGDLFFQRTLLDGAERELDHLLDATAGQEIVFVVGMPVRMGGLLFNCAVVCQNGEILGVVPKSHLIFEENVSQTGPFVLSQTFFIVPPSILILFYCISDLGNCT